MRKFINIVRVQVSKKLPPFDLCFLRPIFVLCLHATSCRPLDITLLFVGFFYARPRPRTHTGAG